MRKDKKETEVEMTEEIATRIINKRKRIKKLALGLIGIGFILILIGYYLNETIVKLGFLFWLLGVGIGVFSNEGKNYKIAQTYIKEEKKNKTVTSIRKKRLNSKVNHKSNIYDIIANNSEIRIGIAPGDGRCGVGYFCDEHSVKSSIEKTKMIIAVLSEKGFETNNVWLGGGTNELSHTGYVSYSAEYESIEKFSSNALSDYITSEKEAQDEYGPWLSCYNFSYFSMPFVKNDRAIQILYEANGTVEIVCRNYIDNDFSIIDEVVTAITSDVYQHDCKVSAYCSGKNGSRYFEYPTDVLKFMK